MIKIKGLTKKFGSFTAVNHLNLQVQENRIFGFLGPNGAGKTTAIRMMVGLLKPTSGSVEINGEPVIFGGTEAHKQFGYLPELPSFYNWMNGPQFLGLVADIFHLPEKDKKARIKELLELVGLEEVKKKKIGAYSGGMKQRLGIAQALINNPKVLILDEPVSALDPIGRREVLQILEKLKKTTTIFMSTHILADVDRICDEVAIINKGKLIVQAPLGELKTKYARPILEVEFVHDPEAIVGKIEGESWVTKVEKSGNHLRIWLADEKIVGTNTPIKALTELGIGILQYGLSLPQVEDLFEEAVEEG